LTIEPTATPRILVVGMSHVAALASALGPGEGARVEVVNLVTARDVFRFEVERLEMGKRDWGDPDVVCMAMGGNMHNWFSLLENPEPFRLGDAAAGSVPADPARRFVPRDMLRALFEGRLKGVARCSALVQAHFPRARFLYLAPPPPVRALRPLDPDAAPPTGPAAQFRYLAFDAAPPDLRRRIYDIEREVLAGIARGLGAPVIDPPAAACSPEGLLGDAFWDEDPTHANATYGRLVLDQIHARTGLAPGLAA